MGFGFSAGRLPGIGLREGIGLKGDADFRVWGFGFRGEGWSLKLENSCLNMNILRDTSSYLRTGTFVAVKAVVRKLDVQLPHVPTVLQEWRRYNLSSWLSGSRTKGRRPHRKESNGAEQNY